MELVACGCICTQLAMHVTVMSYSSCNYRWDVMLATISRGNDTSFLSHGQYKGGMLDMHVSTSKTSSTV